MKDTTRQSSETLLRVPASKLVNQTPVSRCERKQELQTLRAQKHVVRISLVAWALLPGHAHFFKCRLIRRFESICEGYAVADSFLDIVEK